MVDVVTFGEAMVRLSTPGPMRLEQARSLDAGPGGSEYNVAINTSRLGLSSAWVSRLPDNPLGRLVRNKAREQGVDTSRIVWTKEGRVGLYFLEFGASPRASSVLYDRANSAICSIGRREVDWRDVLDNAKVFFVSGITPALSDSTAAATAEALTAAKKAGCLVCYDLNYRKKLWTEEEARFVQEPMMDRIDILITTEEDTRRILKIGANEEKDSDFSSVSAESYKSVAKELLEKYGFSVVVITLRENISVTRNTWTAIGCDGKRVYEDRKYDLEVVDRVGGGDSFVAGFLRGYLEKRNVQRGLEVGDAFCALKHSVPGDYNWSSMEEVEQVIKTGALRIQR